MAEKLVHAETWRRHGFKATIPTDSGMTATSAVFTDLCATNRNEFGLLSAEQKIRNAKRNTQRLQVPSQTVGHKHPNDKNATSWKYEAVKRFLTAKSQNMQ